MFKRSNITPSWLVGWLQKVQLNKALMMSSEAARRKTVGFHFSQQKLDHRKHFLNVRCSVSSFTQNDMEARSTPGPSSLCWRESRHDQWTDFLWPLWIVKWFESGSYTWQCDKLQVMRVPETMNWLHSCSWVLLGNSFQVSFGPLNP